MEWVPDSSKLSIGPCCRCCCKHFSDLTQPQRWCSGRHAVYLWPPSLGAGVTVSFGIILSLHTRSFQPMPASTPDSVNQNSYNSTTGHSNRCGVVDFTHTEKGKAVCDCCLRRKNIIFSHTHTQTDLKCCRSLSCAALMRAEGFRSLTIYMSALYSVTITWGFCPAETEGFFFFFFLQIFLWFTTFMSLMPPDSVFSSTILPMTEGLEVFPIGVELNVTLARQKRKSSYCLSCRQSKLSFSIHHVSKTVYNTTISDSYPPSVIFTPKSHYYFFHQFQ